MLPFYVAAAAAAMLAGAAWRYRKSDMVGMAACLAIAGRCAYALTISQPAPSLAQTTIARCEFFLLMLKSHERGMAYKPLGAVEQANPPKVTIEFEMRNKAHALGRSIGSCEFDRDRRQITFFTLDGRRSQILQN
ncbi:hypothetical protein EH240_31000 [Mesorhizobium tamadayense]|uniref:Uncharacterized protein n=1 Tax=Mesorhizobium tamadayense TaxID=425306 RepID=A0A3P3F2J9_9HYPH|nr:hypothetical protein [Mesorhizobium tamadayense]RRH92835.1 hypothetical protein EH240_31000 [Mesorhizobium tamadayense]